MVSLIHNIYPEQPLRRGSSISLRVRPPVSPCFGKNLAEMRQERARLCGPEANERCSSQSKCFRWVRSWLRRCWRHAIPVIGFHPDETRTDSAHRLSPPLILPSTSAPPFIGNLCVFFVPMMVPVVFSVWRRTNPCLTHRTVAPQPILSTTRRRFR